MKPPPLKSPLFDRHGNISNVWALWFQAVYEGDQGTPWTPTFVDLASTGTPVITGRYHRLSQGLVFFTVTITPEAATTTTSVFSGAYMNNFPLDLKADGVFQVGFNVEGAITASSGFCQESDNNFYVPAWTDNPSQVIISGLIEAL